MKLRTLLSTLLILCSIALFAQISPEDNFRQGYYQWVQQHNKQAETYKNAKVHYLTSTYSKLDEDSVLIRSRMNSRLELDTQGRIILYQNLWRRGRISNEIRISYDDESRIKTIQYGTGKRKTLYEYEYFNDSLIAAIKGQTKHDAYFYKYNYNSKLELTEMSFHKNAKQVKRLEYSYYENGTKKETKVFDKRNKLKQTYSYACGIDESVKKKKNDTSYVCSNTTVLPDGSKQRVTENIDDKGRVSRSVFTYNEKTKYSMIERYNHKNQMEMSSENLRLGETYLNLYMVYRKGKLKRSYKTFTSIDKFKMESRITKYTDGTFRCFQYSYTYY
ncbi:MAG: hypothetical protein EP332_13730 [Bacteroidetes bacterium]|nr:MAG: hypothetical protein EP332_13730 [Bacteroidota bacterium]